MRVHFNRVALARGASPTRRLWVGNSRPRSYVGIRYVREHMRKDLSWTIFPDLNYLRTSFTINLLSSSPSSVAILDQAILAQGVHLARRRPPVGTLAAS